MPPNKRVAIDARLATRRRNVLRTEVATAVGSVLIGGLFLAGNHAMHEISIFLFGWALGCAVHLTQVVITNQLARRRNAQSAADGGDAAH